MTLWIHRYELRPRVRLNARTTTSVRHGALLRRDDGFADIHPWPELGDAPLEVQIAMLARGEMTRLTERSLHFAAIDGAARRAESSLFDGLVIPESHWPAAAGEAPAAFDTVKVKMPGGEVPPSLRLRLDFNALLDASAFLDLAETLPRERIDFIEDPCAYDPVVWSRLREQTGLRLALDREVAAEGVDVLVVKPAIQVLPAGRGCEIVITSYMDHAVGQLHAARVAAVAAGDAETPVSSRSGLLTHLLYEPDPFTERLGLDGARLVPPGGSGIGFDDLLENLSWSRLT